jgi:hypothetical protein
MMSKQLCRIGQSLYYAVTANGGTKGIETAWFLTLLNAVYLEKASNPLK